MGKLLHDEHFRYVSYHSTDVRKTFARERKRLAEEKAKREAEAKAVDIEAQQKVRTIKGATK